MSVTDRTLRAAENVRRTVNRQVNGVTRSLTAAWVQAWDEVVGEWRAALAELVAASADGGWPSRGALTRFDRAQQAIEITHKRLLELYAEAGQTISAKLPEVTAEAAQWEARLIGSQLPPNASVVLGVTFDRVDPIALEAIVTRTTQQVNSALWPLAAEATAAMHGELVRGIAAGTNPRRAAALMLRRVRGRFDGGLARAVNIARTEMLDAHRYAARAQDLANADVVEEWVWLAKLDRRTCPSCLAQHGTSHPLDEVGPIDHQQGRCDRLPVTKPWRALGFDIDEPPGLSPESSQAWFDGQSEEDQVAIMGAERLALLRSGEVSWDELSQRRTNPGWRDSMVPTPVSQLRRDA